MAMCNVENMKSMYQRTVDELYPAADGWLTGPQLRKLTTWSHATVLVTIRERGGHHAGWHIIREGDKRGYRFKVLEQPAKIEKLGRFDYPTKPKTTVSKCCVCKSEVGPNRAIKFNGNTVCPTCHKRAFVHREKDVCNRLGV